MELYFLATPLLVILIWAALEGLVEYMQANEYEIRRQSVINDHNEGR
jgi:hypothetical protein